MVGATFSIGKDGSIKTFYATDIELAGSTVLARRELSRPVPVCGLLLWRSWFEPGRSHNGSSGIAARSYAPRSGIFERREEIKVNLLAGKPLAGADGVRRHDPKKRDSALKFFRPIELRRRCDGVEFFLYLRCRSLEPCFFVKNRQKLDLSPSCIEIRRCRDPNATKRSVNSPQNQNSFYAYPWIGCG